MPPRPHHVRPAARAAFALLVGALLPACGAPNGDAGAADAGGTCAFHATPEVQDPAGAFVPLANASEARLIRGFQGFKFVFARVRFDRLPPPIPVVVLVTLGDVPPRAQSFGELMPASDGAGDLVTDPELVFFNDDPLTDLIGQRCGLTFVVGRSDCGARVSGTVKLVYDANCVHGPTGEVTCGDGGMSPDGGA